MSLSCVCFRHYDVFTLSGTLTYSSLPQITPEFNRYIETASPRHLVIDLSGADLVDSSILRLFVNLKKHLEVSRRGLYLLQPNPAVDRILRETNLDKAIVIVSKPADLAATVARRFKEHYLPYSSEFRGLRKLSLGCPVCASPHVVGYLVDENDFDWKWEGDSIFPSSLRAGTAEVFDTAAVAPIVCTECYFCSIEVGDFNVIDAGGKISVHAAVDDLSKNLLSKSIPKRKKMMQLGVAIGETFFEHPRNAFSCVNLYQLAEACAQTMAVRKASESSFLVGYLNYIALRYSAEEQNAVLINNCRTWLSLVVSDPSISFRTHRAQSFFMLIACALKLDRAKDARAIAAQFQKFMDDAPPPSYALGIEDPRFWFNQAQRLMAEA
jgi:anti-anti-sigma factor